MDIYNLQEQVKVYDAYRNKGYAEGYKDGELHMQEFVEEKCKKLGIDYTLIFTCNSDDNLKKKKG